MAKSPINAHRLFYPWLSIPVFALFACMILLPARFCVAETPPGPPLLGSPPDMFEWTIDVKQKTARPTPPSDPKWNAAYKKAMDTFPRMVHVTIKKSGKDRFEETSYENGKSGVMYLYKGWVVYRQMDWPTDKALALPIGHRDSPVINGVGPDFPDLSWIRPEVFVKTVTYHGQRCHYYSDNNAPPLKGGDTLNPAASSKGVRAWIDVKTRLPVAVEDAGVLKKYTYDQKPVSIQLTGVFEAAYKSALSAAKPQDESPSAPR